jgi:two-component system KDP operon response regulator KdpE
MSERLTRRADDLASILVVDDDQRMRRLLKVNLEGAGYKVTAVADGAAALESAELEPPDLIVLDVMMPRMDGFTVLQRLREFSMLPVILLTAKGEEHDKVRGLDLGADDYLTKPFGPPELLARVRAALRRRAQPIEMPPTATITAGNITINLARRQVSRDGHEIRLTPTEYKLLYELVVNRGRVLLHNDLLTRVWGPEYRDQMENLWTYVRYLRQKIEADPAQPRYIVSEPGVGYYFSPE